MAAITTPTRYPVRVLPNRLLAALTTATAVVVVSAGAVVHQIASEGAHVATAAPAAHGFGTYSYGQRPVFVMTDSGLEYVARQGQPR